MDNDQVILARKYATAFLNLFIDELTIDDMQALASACTFLKAEPEVTSIFKIPRMDETKKEIIDRIFKKFNLAPVLKNLIPLLMQQQRLFLLLAILHSIQELYRERRGIMEFELQSSHALTDNQITTIKDFLSAKTDNHIIYTWKENKDLIAGIRLQSNTLLWERSIARRLAEVQRLLAL